MIVGTDKKTIGGHSDVEFTEGGLWIMIMDAIIHNLGLTNDCYTCWLVGYKK